MLVYPFFRLALRFRCAPAYGSSEAAPAAAFRPEFAGRRSQSSLRPERSSRALLRVFLGHSNSGVALACAPLPSELLPLNAEPVVNGMVG